MANNWLQLLILAVVVLLKVAFYLILGYMPTYLSGQLGHSTAQCNWILVAIPPVVALSDRIGRKPLLLTAAIGYAELSVPAIAMLGMDSLIDCGALQRLRDRV